MSERKVLNKYYPPDYDPSKIPRARRPKNRQWNIRTMAPFNMRCNTCGEYIYKGKKFNSRQELAEGETYLGLKIFRFYIRCPKCVSEITFKTDPESVDYKLEAGGTRNFEALRTAEMMAAKEAKEKEEELENNPMKMLENRTKASQREMDMLETLEDLRELNSKHSKVDLDQEIDKYRIYEEKLKQLQDEEDERFIQSVFSKTGEHAVKRLPDSDSEDDDDAGPSKAKILKIDNPTDVLTKDTSESPDNSRSTPIPSRTQAKGKAGQKNGGLTKSSISMMIKKKKPENKSKSSANCDKSSEKDGRETVAKDLQDTSANCQPSSAKVTIETITMESDTKSELPDNGQHISTCNAVDTANEGTAQTEISESVSGITVAKEASTQESEDTVPQASGLSLLGNYSDSSDGGD